jgi:hypothetical protein
VVAVGVTVTVTVGGGAVGVGVADPGHVHPGESLGVGEGVGGVLDGTRSARLAVAAPFTTRPHSWTFWPTETRSVVVALGLGGAAVVGISVGTGVTGTVSGTVVTVDVVVVGGGTAGVLGGTGEGVGVTVVGAMMLGVTVVGVTLVGGTGVGGTGVGGTGVGGTGVGDVVHPGAADGAPLVVSLGPAAGPRRPRSSTTSVAAVNVQVAV